MPSDPKYTKKKPTAKARGGLYKPGEEIKPQRRPQNLFKGYPKVNRPTLDQNRGAASLSRNKLYGSTTSKADMSSRASDLYHLKGQQKLDLGEAKDLPKESRAKGIKKLNRDMNRLAKVMTHSDEGNARTNFKAMALHSKISSVGDKPSLWKRVNDLYRGALNYTPKSKMRSPVSPAAVAFEIGMSHYKAGQTKSAKKIKSLNKYKKGA